jgi:EH_Signature domain
LTFFGVKSEPSAYLCVQVKVKTKALSLVYLNPDHQDLIDRILGLHAKGWIPKKISEHLNALGVNSWSGIPMSSSNQSVLDDPVVLETFLGDERGVGQWRSKPAWFRRAIQGLVISYFTFDPNGTDVSERKKQGWKTLRNFLSDNISAAAEENNPDWLQCCIDHKSLFSDSPGRSFAPKLLAGKKDELNTVLELLRAKESWFPRELVLGQIKYVVDTYDVESFQEIVDQLLDMLQEHKTIVDDGLCLLINRYAVSKNPPVHDRLKDMIVLRWDNPWLQGATKKWHPEASKAAKDLVTEWLTGEFIEAFFTKLSEEANSDSRRMNFWMTYRKQMSHVRFALGSNFLNSLDPDVIFLRSKMRGLYTKIKNNSKSNAFIMFMGDLIAVEFSSVSNALYMYDASSGMPFDVNQEFWDAVNVGNTLKNQRLGDRQSHQDRIKGYERWEQRIADTLFTNYGINNEVWKPTRYASSQKLVSAAGSSAGLYVGSGGLSNDKSSSVTDDRIPVFNNRLPSNSAIDKVLVGRTSWADLFAKPFSIELLMETAKVFDFRVEDNKAIGGATWVRVDGENPTRNRVLRNWGFQYKANKGWWR